METNLTIRDHRGELIARITAKTVRNDGKHIKIEFNSKTGSVVIHYRGKPLTVSGKCRGNLETTGNINLRNITVQGDLKQNP